MKKLQNRALACLLTLCMLLSVLPVGSFAQEQDNGSFRLQTSLPRHGTPTPCAMSMKTT